MYKINILLILTFSVIFNACSSNYPSKEETENFCLIVEEAINNNSTEFLNLLFEPQPLINKVTKDIDAPAYYEEGFMEGFQQAYSIGEVMSAQSYAFDAYTTFLKLKKYKENSDTIIALYRTNADQGLNYQELYLSPNENGELHIFDYYSYSEGDLFSESIRRLYIINLTMEIDSFSHPLAESLPVINEIAALADKKQYAEALQILEAVPTEVKNEKIVQLIRLSLANEISEATLKSVAQDFKQTFPDDNLVYLKMLELAYSNNNFTQIIESLDSLNTNIGGDAYINVLKASAYRDNAQDDIAEKLLKNAIKEEPLNDDAYWLLLDIYIVQKRYDNAISIFTKIKNTFEQNAAEYIVYDGYNDFYKSPQFRNWISNNPIDSTNTILEGFENIDSLYNSFQGGGGHSH